MQAAKIVWTKKDAGFQAEMPGDVTLYVTPDQTAGAFGAKAKRGTQWRAGVSVWNAKTSTLSRFGRDAYGEMCADAKTAKALAESIYRAEISDRETQAAMDAANGEAAPYCEPKRYQVQQRTDRAPQWVAVHAFHDQAKAEAFAAEICTPTRAARLGLEVRVVDLAADVVAPLEVSRARYTVAEVKSWTKPGCHPVAAHCIPSGQGWTLEVTGYRVKRPDGSTYRPAYPAFPTREEAEAETARLNA